MLTHPAVVPPEVPTVPLSMGKVWTQKRRWICINYVYIILHMFVKIYPDVNMYIRFSVFKTHVKNMWK